MYSIYTTILWSTEIEALVGDADTVLTQLIFKYHIQSNLHNRTLQVRKSSAKVKKSKTLTVFFQQRDLLGVNRFI